MREGGLVARPEGFEPSTAEVEARCSSPLSYGRLARRVGFEPTTSGFEARRSSPLSYRRQNYLRRRLRSVVWVAGFEPATTRFQSGDSDQAELHPEIVGRGSGRDIGRDCT